MRYYIIYCLLCTIMYTSKSSSEIFHTEHISNATKSLNLLSRSSEPSLNPYHSRTLFQYPDPQPYQSAQNLQNDNMFPRRRQTDNYNYPQRGWNPQWNFRAQGYRPMLRKRWNLFRTSSEPLSNSTSNVSATSSADGSPGGSQVNLTSNSGQVMNSSRLPIEISPFTPMNSEYSIQNRQVPIWQVPQELEQEPIDPYKTYNPNSFNSLNSLSGLDYSNENLDENSNFRSDNDGQRPIALKRSNPNIDDNLSDLVSFRAHLHHNVRDIGRTFLQKEVKKDVGSGLDLDSSNLNSDLVWNQLINSPSAADPIADRNFQRVWSDEYQQPLDTMQDPRMYESNNFFRSENAEENVQGYDPYQGHVEGPDGPYAASPGNFYPPGNNLKSNIEFESQNFKENNNFEGNDFINDLDRDTRNDPENSDHLVYLDKYSRAIDDFNQNWEGNNEISSSVSPETSSTDTLKTPEDQENVNKTSLAMVIEPLTAQLQKLLSSIQQVNEKLMKDQNSQSGLSPMDNLRRKRGVNDDLDPGDELYDDSTDEDDEETREERSENDDCPEGTSKRCSENRARSFKTEKLEIPHFYEIKNPQKKSNNSFMSFFQKTFGSASTQPSKTTLPSKSAELEETTIVTAYEEHNPQFGEGIERTTMINSDVTLAVQTNLSPESTLTQDQTSISIPQTTIRPSENPITQRSGYGLQKKIAENVNHVTAHFLEPAQEARNQVETTMSSASDLETLKVAIEPIPNDLSRHFLRTSSKNLLMKIIPQEMIQNITENGIIVQIPGENSVKNTEQRPSNDDFKPSIHEEEQAILSPNKSLWLFEGQGHLKPPELSTNNKKSIQNGDQSPEAQNYRGNDAVVAVGGDEDNESDTKLTIRLRLPNRSRSLIRSQQNGNEKNNQDGGNQIKIVKKRSESEQEAEEETYDDEEELDQKRSIGSEYLEEQNSQFDDYDDDESEEDEDQLKIEEKRSEKTEQVAPNSKIVLKLKLPDGLEPASDGLIQFPEIQKKKRQQKQKIQKKGVKIGRSLKAIFDESDEDDEDQENVGRFARDIDNFNLPETTIEEATSTASSGETPVGEIAAYSRLVELMGNSKAREDEMNEGQSNVSSSEYNIVQVSHDPSEISGSSSNSQLAEHQSSLSTSKSEIVHSVKSQSEASSPETSAIQTSEVQSELNSSESSTQNTKDQEISSTVETTTVQSSDNQSYLSGSKTTPQSSSTIATSELQNFSDGSQLTSTDVETRLTIQQSSLTSTEAKSAPESPNSIMGEISTSENLQATFKMDLWSEINEIKKTSQLTEITSASTQNTATSILTSESSEPSIETSIPIYIPTETINTSTSTSQSLSPSSEIPSRATSETSTLMSTATEKIEISTPASVSESSFTASETSSTPLLDLGTSGASIKTLIFTTTNAEIGSSISDIIPISETSITSTETSTSLFKTSDTAETSLTSLLISTSSEIPSITSTPISTSINTTSTDEFAETSVATTAILISSSEELQSSFEISSEQTPTSYSMEKSTTTTPTSELTEEVEETSISDSATEMFILSSEKLGAVTTGSYEVESTLASVILSTTELLTSSFAPISDKTNEDVSQFSTEAVAEELESSSSTPVYEVAIEKMMKSTDAIRTDFFITSEILTASTSAEAESELLISETQNAETSTKETTEKPASKITETSEVRDTTTLYFTSTSGLSEKTPSIFSLPEKPIVSTIFETISRSVSTTEVNEIESTSTSLSSSTSTEVMTEKSASRLYSSSESVGFPSSIAITDSSELPLKTSEVVSKITEKSSEMTATTSESTSESILSSQNSETIESTSESSSSSTQGSSTYAATSEVTERSFTSILSSEVTDTTENSTEDNAKSVDQTSESISTSEVTKITDEISKFSSTSTIDAAWAEFASSSTSIGKSSSIKPKFSKVPEMSTSLEDEEEGEEEQRTSDVKSANSSSEMSQTSETEDEKILKGTSEETSEITPKTSSTTPNSEEEKNSEITSDETSEITPKTSSTTSEIIEVVGNTSEESEVSAEVTSKRSSLKTSRTLEDQELETSELRTEATAESSTSSGIKIEEKTLKETTETSSTTSGTSGESSETPKAGTKTSSKVMSETSMIKSKTSKLEEEEETSDHTVQTSSTKTSEVDVNSSEVIPETSSRISSKTLSTEEEKGEDEEESTSTFQIPKTTIQFTKTTLPETTMKLITVKASTVSEKTTITDESLHTPSELPKVTLMSTITPYLTELIEFFSSTDVSEESTSITQKSPVSEVAMTSHFFFSSKAAENAPADTSSIFLTDTTFSTTASSSTTVSTSEIEVSTSKEPDINMASTIFLVSSPEIELVSNETSTFSTSIETSYSSETTPSNSILSREFFTTTEIPENVEKIVLPGESTATSISRTIPTLPLIEQNTEESTMTPTFSPHIELTSTSTSTTAASTSRVEAEQTFFVPMTTATIPFISISIFPKNVFTSTPEYSSPISPISTSNPTSILLEEDFKTEISSTPFINAPKETESLERVEEPEEYETEIEVEETTSEDEEEREEYEYEEHGSGTESSSDYFEYIDEQLTGPWLGLTSSTSTSEEVTDFNGSSEVPNGKQVTESSESNTSLDLMTFPMTYTPIQFPSTTAKTSYMPEIATGIFATTPASLLSSEIIINLPKLTSTFGESIETTPEVIEFPTEAPKRTEVASVSTQKSKTTTAETTSEFTEDGNIVTTSITTRTSSGTLPVAGISTRILNISGVTSETSQITSGTSQISESTSQNYQLASESTEHQELISEISSTISEGIQLHESTSAETSQFPLETVERLDSTSPVSTVFLSTSSALSTSSEFYLSTFPLTAMPSSSTELPFSSKTASPPVGPITFSPHEVTTPFLPWETAETTEPLTSIITEYESNPFEFKSEVEQAETQRTTEVWTLASTKVWSAESFPELQQGPSTIGFGEKPIEVKTTTEFFFDVTLPQILERPGIAEEEYPEEYMEETSSSKADATSISFETSLGSSEGETVKLFSPLEQISSSPATLEPAVLHTSASSEEPTAESEVSMSVIEVTPTSDTEILMSSIFPANFLTTSLTSFNKASTASSSWEPSATSEEKLLSTVEIPKTSVLFISSMSPPSSTEAFEFSASTKTGTHFSMPEFQDLQSSFLEHLPTSSEAASSTAVPIVVMSTFTGLLEQLGSSDLPLDEKEIKLKTVEQQQLEHRKKLEQKIKELKHKEETLLQRETELFRKQQIWEHEKERRQQEKELQEEQKLRKKLTTTTTVEPTITTTEFPTTTIDYVKLQELEDLKRKQEELTDEIEQMEKQIADKEKELEEKERKLEEEEKKHEKEKEDFDRKWREQQEKELEEKEKELEEKEKKLKEKENELKGEEDETVGTSGGSSTSTEISSTSELTAEEDAEQTLLTSTTEMKVPSTINLKEKDESDITPTSEETSPTSEEFSTSEEIASNSEEFTTSELQFTPIAISSTVLNSETSEKLISTTSPMSERQETSTSLKSLQSTHPRGEGDEELDDTQDYVFDEDEDVWKEKPPEDYDRQINKDYEEECVTTDDLLPEDYYGGVRKSSRKKNLGESRARSGKVLCVPKHHHNRKKSRSSRRRKLMNFEDLRKTPINIREKFATSPNSEKFHEISASADNLHESSDHLRKFLEDLYNFDKKRSNEAVVYEHKVKPIASLDISQGEWLANESTLPLHTPIGFTRVYESWSKVPFEPFTFIEEYTKRGFPVRDETFMRKGFKVNRYDQRIQPTQVDRLVDDEWGEVLTERTPNSATSSTDEVENDEKRRKRQDGDYDEGQPTEYPPEYEENCLLRQHGPWRSDRPDIENEDTNAPEEDNVFVEPEQDEDEDVVDVESEDSEKSEDPSEDKLENFENEEMNETKDEGESYLNAESETTSENYENSSISSENVKENDDTDTKSEEESETRKDHEDVNKTANDDSGNLEDHKGDLKNEGKGNRNDESADDLPEELHTSPRSSKNENEKTTSPMSTSQKPQTSSVTTLSSPLATTLPDYGDIEYFTDETMTSNSEEDDYAVEEEEEEEEPNEETWEDYEDQSSDKKKRAEPLLSLQSLLDSRNLLRIKKNELLKREKVLREKQKKLKSAEDNLKILKRHRFKRKLKKLRKSLTPWPIEATGRYHLGGSEVWDVGILEDPRKDFKKNKQAFTVNVLRLDYDEVEENHKLKCEEPKKYELIINQGLITKLTEPMTSKTMKIDSFEATTKQLQLHFDENAGGDVVAKEKIASRNSKKTTKGRTIPGTDWPTERTTKFHLGGTRSWDKELTGTPEGVEEKRKRRGEEKYYGQGVEVNGSNDHGESMICYGTVRNSGDKPDDVYDKNGQKNEISQNRSLHSINDFQFNDRSPRNGFRCQKIQSSNYISTSAPIENQITRPEAFPKIKYIANSDSEPVKLKLRTIKSINSQKNKKLSQKPTPSLQMKNKNSGSFKRQQIASSRLVTPSKIAITSSKTSKVKKAEENHDRFESLENFPLIMKMNNTEIIKMSNFKIPPKEIYVVYKYGPPEIVAIVNPDDNHKSLEMSLENHSEVNFNKDHQEIGVSKTVNSENQPNDEDIEDKNEDSNIKEENNRYSTELRISEVTNSPSVVHCTMKTQKFKTIFPFNLSNEAQVTFPTIEAHVYGEVNGEAKVSKRHSKRKKKKKKKRGRRKGHKHRQRNHKHLERRILSWDDEIESKKSFKKLSDSVESDGNFAINSQDYYLFSKNSSDFKIQSGGESKTINFSTNLLRFLQQVPIFRTKNPNHQKFTNESFFTQFVPISKNQNVSEEVQNSRLRRSLLSLPISERIKKKSRKAKKKSKSRRKKLKKFLFGKKLNKAKNKKFFKREVVSGEKSKLNVIDLFDKNPNAHMKKSKVPRSIFDKVKQVINNVIGQGSATTFRPRVNINPDDEEQNNDEGYTEIVHQSAARFEPKEATLNLNEEQNSKNFDNFENAKHDFRHHKKKSKNYHEKDRGHQKGHSHRKNHGKKSKNHHRSHKNHEKLEKKSNKKIEKNDRLLLESKMPNSNKVSSSFSDGSSQKYDTSLKFNISSIIPTVKNLVENQNLGNLEKIIVYVDKTENLTKKKRNPTSNSRSASEITPKNVKKRKHFNKSRNSSKVHLKNNSRLAHDLNNKKSKSLNHLNNKKHLKTSEKSRNFIKRQKSASEHRSENPLKLAAVPRSKLSSSASGLKELTFSGEKLEDMISNVADKILSSVSGSGLDDLDVKVIQQFDEGHSSPDTATASEFTLDLSGLSKKRNGENLTKLKRVADSLNSSNVKTWPRFSRLTSNSAERKMNLKTETGKRRNFWKSKIERKKFVEEIKNKLQSELKRKLNRKRRENSNFNVKKDMEKPLPHHLDDLDEKIRILYSLHHKNSKKSKESQKQSTKNRINDRNSKQIRKKSKTIRASSEGSFNHRRVKRDDDFKIDHLKSNIIADENDKKSLKALIGQIISLQKNVNKTLMIIRKKLDESPNIFSHNFTQKKTSSSQVKTLIPLKISQANTSQKNSNTKHFANPKKDKASNKTNGNNYKNDQINQKIKHQNENKSKNNKNFKSKNEKELKKIKKLKDSKQNVKNKLKLKSKGEKNEKKTDKNKNKYGDEQVEKIGNQIQKILKEEEGGGKFFERNTRQKKIKRRKSRTLKGISEEFTPIKIGRHLCSKNPQKSNGKSHEKSDKKLTNLKSSKFSKKNSRKNATKIKNPQKIRNSKTSKKSSKKTKKSIKTLKNNKQNAEQLKSKHLFQKNHEKICNKTEKANITDKLKNSKSFSKNATNLINLANANEISSTFYTSNSKNCESCLCDLEIVINDLRKMLLVKNDLLDRISTYSCQKFVNIGDELILTSTGVLGDVLPRSRRQIAEAKGLKYIRPGDLEDLLSGEEINGHEHEILSFPGSDLNIPCNHEGEEITWIMSISRPNYTWTRIDNSPISGIIRKNGNLELYDVDAKDAGNYSCIVTYIDPDNEELVENVYQHSIEIVTLPRYSLRGGNRYKIEMCEETILDILSAYLPSKLTDILCRNAICDVFIFAPHCYSHQVSLRILVVPTSPSKLFPISTSQCGLRCRKAMQDKMAILLSQNLRIVLRKRIVFRLPNRPEDRLLPIEKKSFEENGPRGRRAYGKKISSGDADGEVGLLVGCPAGYGLENNHCGPCPAHHYSQDLSARCKRCPLGSHQPSIGSRMCRTCTNPFVEGCYDMLWTTSSILIGVFASLFAILFVGIIILWSFCCGKRQKKSTNELEMTLKQPLIPALENPNGNSSEEEEILWEKPKKKKKRLVKRFLRMKDDERPSVYGINLLPKQRKEQTIKTIPVCCIESYRSHGGHCHECKHQFGSKKNYHSRPPVPYPDFDR